MTKTSITPNYSPINPPHKSPWSSYLNLGIALNTAVWGLAFLYLKLAPHTYTSQWGVKIIETDPGVEVSLPNVGKATSSPSNRSSVTASDPRTDYVYIAENPGILKEAAKRVDLPVEDFGKAEITTDENSGIIAFKIDGDSPEEAQKKAQTLYQVITEYVMKLRQAELKRRDGETQATLEAARKKLDVAQEKLSKFKASSSLNSEEQIQQISTNIEELRRQKADLYAEEQGLRSSFQELSTELELSSSEATDAYKLVGDDVYKRQYQQYAQAKTALTDLLSRFTTQHPQVISKQAEVEDAAAALQERAYFILGKPIALQTLAQLTPLTIDPREKVKQQELYQSLVLNRVNQKQISAQNQELDRQITRFDTRLKNLAQEKFTVDSLQRDLEVAEAIFAATLAKLDLALESTYSTYPPVQLVIEPSLAEPDEPTNPRTSAVLLGGLAASFLVTTGVVLFWFDKRGSQEKFTFSNLPPQTSDG